MWASKTHLEELICVFMFIKRILLNFCTSLFHDDIYMHVKQSYASPLFIYWIISSIHKLKCSTFQ